MNLEGAASLALAVYDPEVDKDTNVVWRPLPGSQELVLACPGDEILNDGTRGGGKTDSQLMRFRMRVGLGYGAFWRGVIFDREYKNLEDIIAKSLRWFYQFGDGVKFTAGGGGGKWSWPTGEELVFRHIKRLSDYWKYHGHEYPFIGWNELTKYPTSELYDMMKSCNRSSFRPQDYPRPDGTLLPEIPLEIHSTANPLGPGHGWVKRKWVDKAAPGQLVRRTTNVFNPRTKEQIDVTRTQVRIFSSYRENIYLAPEYVADLANITDENKKKAWLDGDWNITAGGALDGVWGDHLFVPRFAIPKNWYLDRSFDWGSTHPFSVGWWAEANGEEVKLPNGMVFAPVKGSLIRFAEWYGTEEIGTNKGLRLTSRKIARGIKQREEQMRKEGWIHGTVQPGPADNQIAENKEGRLPSIKKKMEALGVRWTASNKSAGSRKLGLQLLREMCEAAKTGDGPGIYFMQNCNAAISTLSVLPRDEKNVDDVDSASEDHIYDDTRYRILNLRRTSSVKPLRTP
jgi:hypothetical protein